MADEKIDFAAAAADAINPVGAVGDLLGSAFSSGPAVSQSGDAKSGGKFFGPVDIEGITRGKNSGTVLVLLGIAAVVAVLLITRRGK